VCSSRVSADMTHSIFLYRNRQRWEVSYPQRHFVTPTSVGHVYQLNSQFSTFKDAILFGKEYKQKYVEWQDISFTYMCNNGGKMEIHDMDDDATVLEFILRLQE
jgi:hypothetical protein